MSEFRQNPITREWVIIATERARRPDQFVIKENRREIAKFVADCPFCPGNEHLTPPETFRMGSGSQWQVRAIPNKFSALMPEGAHWRRVEGMKRTASGVGKHEVIIETPDHSMTTALLPLEQVVAIVNSYRQRYLEIAQVPGVELITIFKNHGSAAGTSLEHPHSQLIATPIISPQVRARMEEALRHFDEAGECVFCRLLADELREKVRVITENEDFVAYIPYAELSPFACLVFPRRHMASFGEIQDQQAANLASILKDLLARLYYGLENPDFNYTIRTSPCENRYVRYYHWYVSVIPRLTKVAGFELGSGFFVNVTSPEHNAEFLRNVKVPQTMKACAS